MADIRVETIIDAGVEKYKLYVHTGTFQDMQEVADYLENNFTSSPPSPSPSPSDSPSDSLAHPEVRNVFGL